jgi:hypothetical protein
LEVGVRYPANVEVFCLIFAVELPSLAHIDTSELFVFQLHPLKSPRHLVTGFERICIVLPIVEVTRPINLNAQASIDHVDVHSLLVIVDLGL